MAKEPLINAITREDKQMPVSRAFDVYLNGKCIDTVFYSWSHHAKDTKQEAEKDVYRSLVKHDGYNPDIYVKMRKER